MPETYGKSMESLWKIYGPMVPDICTYGFAREHLDYDGLSWIIIYYHGLSICADYPNKVQIK
jgi:hypothetical protein